MQATSFSNTQDDKMIATKMRDRIGRRAMYALVLTCLAATITSWVLPRLIPPSLQALAYIGLISGAVGRLVLFRDGRLSIHRDKLSPHEQAELDKINRSSWPPFWACAVCMLSAWTLHLNAHALGAAHTSVLLALVALGMAFGLACYRWKMAEKRIYSRFTNMA